MEGTRKEPTKDGEEEEEEEESKLKHIAKHHCCLPILLAKTKMNHRGEGDGLKRVRAF